MWTSCVSSLRVYSAFSLCVVLLTTVLLLGHVHLRPTVIMRECDDLRPSLTAQEKVPFNLTNAQFYFFSLLLVFVFYFTLF